MRSVDQLGENGDLTGRFAAEPFCYLTTVGRRSGRDHTIEIWFAAEGRTLYLISGGGARSDWVRNLVAQPEARVAVGGWSLHVRARLPLVEPPEERERAVRLLHAKYGRRESSLESWLRDAFIVALDVVSERPA